MSTRSQIVIKDSKYGDEQWFYRHSDGYIEGNMPELYKFMTWLHENKIRNNVEQSAGWLILIGAEEYGYTWDKNMNERKKDTITEPENDPIGGWKCGAYEICTCGELHSDVEWLYIIDLKDNSIEITEVYSNKTKRFTYDELETYSKDWERLDKECF